MINKEKIFFVYPQNDKKDIETMPPYDVMLMSYIAKKKGFDTQFRNYNLNNSNVYDFLRDLRIFKPDFLVIVVSDFIEKELSILTQAGDLLEKVVVIVKGEEFIYNSCAIMQKYPEIDIALKQDYERSFEEIISYKNLKDINNITYQVRNKIVCTPKSPLKENKLVCFDKELNGLSSYFLPKINKPFAPVNYSNIFISAGMVIDEIKECISKNKINNFILYTDDFLCDTNKAYDFLNLIKKEKLSINYAVNIDILSLDDEHSKLLKLMKKSRCNLVFLNIDYKTNFETVKKAQKFIKKFGLNTILKYKRRQPEGRLSDRLYSFNLV